MLQRLFTLLVPCFALACSRGPFDADGDGVDDTVDCDDHDPAVLLGEPTWTDADGDGWGTGDPVAACAPEAARATVPGDCDDEDPGVFPEANETCDERDEDCDGEIDEAPLDGTAWYVDADGDGAGAGAAVAWSCEPIDGTAANTDDCDDTDAAVSPTATETCDGRDEDCDGAIDEDADGAATWYGDVDGDGYGDPDVEITSCEQPVGAVANDSDCDDADASISPVGSEVCGGGDEDCDGWIDDDDALATAPTWYLDVDGDGHGGALSVVACDAPDGFVAIEDDCDDYDATAWPGADEVCDFEDNDCDGLVDDDPLDGVPWYPDLDEDEYGDPDGAIVACEEIPGRVADGTDCDDANLLVHPGARELCDGGDEDCDGLLADDDPDVADPIPWYVDADGDDYGDDGTAIVACTVPGYVDEGSDCDDADDTIYPGALDACDDGVDADCLGGDQECRIHGEWSLVGADTRWLGSEGSLGAAVDGAGDVDGDGVGDLVAGAPELATGGIDAGAFFVLSGAPGTWDAEGRGLLVLGDNADDALGTAVAGMGDLDGDGLAEVLVGAPGRAPAVSGAVLLFTGATLATGPDASDADATFPSASEGAELGASLARAGDLDGDGLDDALAGAPTDSTAAFHAGSVTLLPGGTWSGTQDPADFLLFLGDGSGMHTGGAMAGAGDVDGDGLADALIGAEADSADLNHAGSAFVLAGPITTDGSVRDLAILCLLGEEPLDEAGAAVAGLGDTDGDGYDDVGVGAPLNARGGYDAGTAYVIRGPRTGDVGLGSADAILEGVIGGGQAGATLAGPGDVDGDGFMDLLVGVPEDTTVGVTGGGAGLWYGPIASGTLSDADAHLVAEGRAGSALAGAGDTDGDGLADFVVGGPGSNMVWLVLGVAR